MVFTAHGYIVARKLSANRRYGQPVSDGTAKKRLVTIRTEDHTNSPRALTIYEFMRPLYGRFHTHLSLSSV